MDSFPRGLLTLVGFTYTRGVYPYPTIYVIHMFTRVFVDLK